MFEAGVGAQDHRLALLWRCGATRRAHSREAEVGCRSRSGGNGAAAVLVAGRFQRACTSASPVRPHLVNLVSGVVGFHAQRHAAPRRVCGKVLQRCQHVSQQARLWEPHAARALAPAARQQARRLVAEARKLRGAAGGGEGWAAVCAKGAAWQGSAPCPQPTLAPLPTCGTPAAAQSGAPRRPPAPGRRTPAPAAPAAPAGGMP